MITATTVSKLLMPVVCAFAIAAAPAGAGDPSPPACDELDWIPTFGGAPGVGGSVQAMVVFDDGSGGGPALYAGGSIGAAGGVVVNGIAKWTGTAWSPLESEMNWTVRALAVFDDGAGGGPALYAGGFFTIGGGLAVHSVAKWNGKAWSPLGSGMSHPVNALTVFDDGLGGGPALYAGGEFTTAGGVTVNRIAKWNGTTWSPLGSGMNGVALRALTVFDNGLGGGPALYAGGDFTIAGGLTVNRVAKWNGATWLPLGSGMNGTVSALTVFDDGSGGGPALYAGGLFSTAGGMTANRIAKWNGTTWSPLGSGMELGSNVFALTAFDDGSGDGPALYAGGNFTTAGGVTANRIAMWNGTSWSPLGSGMSGGGTPVVNALAVFDDGLGGGPVLWAGGGFTSAGSVYVSAIAMWNGTAWSPIGIGVGGVSASVRTFAVFDDGVGDGPALYAGGDFTTAGGMDAANDIAKWNGTAWSPLGSGMNIDVWTLSVFDDGSGGGPALYAGGGFTSAGGVSANRIAKWNGAAWSPLGSGMNGVVRALVVFDDGAGGGPELYAGGGFATAGGVTVNNIAKWNGAEWTPVGGGTNGAVRALAVFDDGSGDGPALYAGGDFTTAGGVTANRVAKWNGTAWSPLGGGMNDMVHALTAFDDGLDDGSALYAGGNFTTADGVTANRIAKWNGTAWSPLGSGMSGGTSSFVDALASFNDGSGGGPALYAGGRFSTAGGVTANHVAKWNGATWSPLESGMLNDVNALTAFDDGLGGGPALITGGIFRASPAGDSYLAKWGCVEFSPPPCAPADLNCDRVVDGNDLAILLGSWGPCGSPPCVADINDDGVIDGNDLAILLGAWDG